MVCYHKEFFGLGLISALFVVGVVILFEDVIIEWLEKILKGI